MIVKRNQILAYLPRERWYQRQIAYWSGIYRHIGIAYNHELIFDARFTGIRLNPIDYRDTFHIYELSEEAQRYFNEEKAWHWALQPPPAGPYGTRYDYLGLIGYLFREKRLQHPGRWFCSELLRKFLEVGGIAIPFPLPSPTDITNLSFLTLIGGNNAKTGVKTRA